MIYGYARVSTKGQAKDGNSLEAQELELRKAGAQIIYKDTYTGAKTDRPELNKLIHELKSGDKIIITKLDRIARSVNCGMELIDSLLDRDVCVHVLNIGLMDNTPMGKLVRSVMFAFAEFERDMIIERTQTGKAIAKQDPNFKEGRPLKYDKLQKEQALELLNTHTYKQIEELTGISKSTLIRYKRLKDRNKRLV